MVAFGMVIIVEAAMHIQVSLIKIIGNLKFKELKKETMRMKFY